MAWNASNNGGSPTSSAPAPKKKSGSSPALAHGLIAGVIVVLVGVIALYFITDDKDAPLENQKNNAKIAEVKADAVTNEEESVTKVVSSEKTAAEMAMERRRERDRINGRRPFVPPSYTSQVSVVTIEQKLFSNRAEQFIAFLLTTEPGESILSDADSMMGRNFKQSLAEASAIKIEMSPDDTEYERELKQQVAAVKSELFGRIKNGEDGETVLRESFEELKNLGVYKQELAEEVKKAIKDGTLSNADVEDTLAAANVMLKQRGLSELKMPSLFKARLRLNYAVPK